MTTSRAAARRALQPLIAVLALALLPLAAAGVREPQEPRPYQYVTKYINVPVDHFSFARNDTFKLRYLVNDTWWERDRRKPGPVFFYTGNEGDIELFAQNTGFMWDIAAEFGALLVFAEHRYYGQSMPFGDKSYSEPKYLGYLTAQQALADFVDVIREVRRGQAPPRTSPVIAFGGSYGGMLSAWIRQKYPHVVAGAISASAPVLMSAGLTPCDAFTRIVTSVFNAEAPNCAGNIRRSWAALRNISRTDAGKAFLSKTFGLRSALRSAGDVEALLSWLNEAYTNVAMANYPYPADFLGNMPAFPVREVCKPLRQKVAKQEDLAKAIFSGISVYFNYTGAAKNLDVNNSDSQLGENGWDFQACTEMVMPMCSDGHFDMFERAPWDEASYAAGCFARWKVHPQFNLTRWEFGGRNLQGSSNIVFSNGLLDPWTAGGVVRSISDTVVAVTIPEGAHHLDLRAANEADPASVRNARGLHREHITKWIKQHRRGYHAGDGSNRLPDMFPQEAASAEHES